MKRKISLNSQWNIRQVPPEKEKTECFTALTVDSTWLTADMPEELYNILRQNGKLEDLEQTGQLQPYVDYCREDWIFRKEFELPREDLSRSGVLRIEGVDTFADIYLNGTLLSQHRDLFLPFGADVSGLLAEKNVLVLYFYSPIVWMENMDVPERYKAFRKSHLLRIDSGGFFPRGAKPFNRPLGIYDDVTLELYDEAWLGVPDIQSSVAPDLQSAYITVTSNISGKTEGLKIRCTLSGELQYEEAAENGGTVFNLVLNKPRLWWPTGYGEQNRYNLKLELMLDGRVLDICEKKLGLRRITMESTLCFKVNGVPIRLWGTNFVPLHAHSYVYDHKKALRLFEYALNANMNALRVWGGGVPYREDLYEDADARGILLWQDFFHDWGMFPDDDDYRLLCRAEAEHMVGKLKHHPSILLWCGGNECYQGSEAEGFNRVSGWEIFEIDYREIVSRLDPQRYYQPNSPYGGSYANDPAVGDSHVYSHIWFNRGWDYPLFQTENTRIYAPHLRSLTRMLGKDNIWTDGYTGQVTKPGEHAIPVAWQKRALMPDCINRYPPIERFYEANEPEGLIYRFGAAHAYHTKGTIERQRRGRPAASDAFGGRKTAGHFVWRFSDLWPEMYCALIDYYMEPYMPYYAVRRAYSPVLVSFEITDRIFVWVVNDTPHAIEGTLEIMLHHPASGENLRETKIPVSVRQGQSLPVTDLDFWGEFRRENFLYARLINKEGVCLASSNDYLDMERNILFPPCVLRLSWEKDRLFVTTDRFARSVELSAKAADGDEFGWFFEDNYFDLFPWEKKEIRFLTPQRRPASISAKARFGGPDAAAKIQVV